ncbi:hypothetical protein [Streptacidiphilus sp. PAMC 29251]
MPSATWAAWHMFLGAAARTEAAQGSLYLHHPRPILVRLLDLTGTGFLLDEPSPAPRVLDPFAAPDRLLVS